MRGLLLAAALVALCGLARADTIFVQSVDLSDDGGSYYLSAAFSIGLTPTALEALNKGVPLNFIFEFELIYPRWYTLYFWNKRITSLEHTYRLSYNALTRQYRISYGVLSESFNTLENALAVLGNIPAQRVLEVAELDEERVYEAQVRMRLDTAQLPKPFQIDALSSDRWDVSSAWFRWTIKR